MYVQLVTWAQRTVSLFFRLCLYVSLSKLLLYSKQTSWSWQSCESHLTENNRTIHTKTPQKLFRNMRKALESQKSPDPNLFQHPWMRLKNSDPWRPQGKQVKARKTSVTWWDQMCQCYGWSVHKYNSCIIFLTLPIITDLLKLSYFGLIYWDYRI